MNKLIFVVDDDPFVADYLAETLQSLGFQPLVFTSAVNITTHVNHHRPAAILLDIVMPQQEGIETLLALKGCAQPPKMIAVSSHEDYLDMAQHLGADAVLIKKVISRQVLADALLSLGITG